ncbi:VOC family protein [Sphingomonas sp. SUN039]|uniref:VOC family protein n=1 Tax=Sphingomonas sp. SUN039 TaxID=2937787 RepID=UPI0021646D04|nr:glyoxalase/bleomycin resistance/extradiol dioxygenase family protein [Sphingomonas sp. SUN039]UVO54822.1 glyoxalase/bleomycin resistance/extradiol dioxygenase family protein [Sphingomonas sp. SUN039]
MARNPDQDPIGGLTPHLTIASGGTAAEAIDWYKKAFGATELMRMPADDGKRLMHAHLVVNGSSLMLNDDFPEYRGGADVGSGPPLGVTLHLQVDDVDAWFDRAVAAGATPAMKPENMFWGDRYGQVADPFGYRWALGAPIEGAGQ